jgi:hypothetical protein
MTRARGLACKAQPLSPIRGIVIRMKRDESKKLAVAKGQRVNALTEAKRPSATGNGAIGERRSEIHVPYSSMLVTGDAVIG